MTHPSALLKQLEQGAKKRFGQHFLCSTRVVQQIVAASGVGTDSRVLEIGPGLGVLTEALLAAGAQLTAVELDRDMAGFIRSRLPEIQLVEADAAQIDFSTLLDGGGWRCVSNLPYNAGTRMITRMLSTPQTFERLVVMVQREVAERLVAPAGDRKRGSLSVFTEARAAARICIRVPPGAFHPPPKVHSAVVDMVLHQSPKIQGVDVAVFDKTVRSLFVQPRKTTRNNLSASLGRELADGVLATVGIEPRRRPATLELGEILALTGAIEDAREG